MSTVGRGGEGDVGQRIRDEILVIQVNMIGFESLYPGNNKFFSSFICPSSFVDSALPQRHNDCKGGMMEEWHQKLHNNTSPDDVIICQVKDISSFWVLDVKPFICFFSFVSRSG